MTTERLSSEPGSKKLQTWPSQTKGQQTAALRRNDSRRERDGGQGPGEVTAPASKAPTPDTAGNSFHHRLQRWRAPGIIFPFRISKAAAGLFWSGNLILRVGFILAPWRTLSAAPDPSPRPTCCRPPLSSPRGSAQRTPRSRAGAKVGPQAVAPYTQGGDRRAPETRFRGPGKGSSYKKAPALRTQWARGCERTWHQASSDRRSASAQQPVPHGHATHPTQTHALSHSLIHTPPSQPRPQLHPQQLTWVHAHDTLPQTNTLGHTAKTNTGTHYTQLLWAHALTLSYTVTHHTTRDSYKPLHFKTQAQTCGHVSTHTSSLPN